MNYAPRGQLGCRSTNTNTCAPILPKVTVLIRIYLIIRVEFDRFLESSGCNSKFYNRRGSPLSGGRGLILTVLGIAGRRPFFLTFKGMSCTPVYKLQKEINQFYMGFQEFWKCWVRKDHKKCTMWKNIFFSFFCATGVQNRSTELRVILRKPLNYLIITNKNNSFSKILRMLMWKRPYKTYHVKEHIFLVLLRYWNPKSVHGARKNRPKTRKIK